MKLLYRQLLDCFKLTSGLLCYLSLLSCFFAEVEIQIEGPAGWAANLPTWRIENHWLLDIFWGGRVMTGYHAWLFSFMALIFHLPLVLFREWTLQIEARILGSLLIFWILEDWFWFVFNPAFGLEHFEPATIPWHKYWLLGMPTDYLKLGVPGLVFILFSNINLTPDIVCKRLS